MDRTGSRGWMEAHRAASRRAALLRSEVEILVNVDDVVMRKVPAPVKDCPLAPVALSDATITERREKIVARMRERGIEQLVVYGDVEHGGNFEYLVGFFPRFEEGLLVIDATGQTSVVLGNENLNKAAKARVSMERVSHASLFSLPNQPQRADKTLRELLADAGIRPGVQTGLVGWKMFTSPVEDNERMFDLPHYVVEAVRALVGDDSLLENACDVFVGEHGVRTTMNANELAHYEFSASLASDCMLDAMDTLDVGVTEMELGDKLVRYGQHTSVVTIAAAGPRFVQANMYPTNRDVREGDTISLTVGYRGGLSSRAGYAVSSADGLPGSVRDYADRVAKPYFAAYATWLERIRVGMEGGELFETIERVLPRDTFGWTLCPGHLTAEEEWLASPVYEGSSESLRSGMMLQIDIISSVAGYGGVSAESTVALADDALKAQIEQEYPTMWKRVCQRRAYIEDVLGIALSPDVLPMCSTVAYLRPHLLNKRLACAACL